MRAPIESSIKSPTRIIKSPLERLRCTPRSIDPPSSRLRSAARPRLELLRCRRPRCSSFPGYNLSGTLPDQLGALASLQTLVLSNNHLVGTPPVVTRRLAGKQGAALGC